MHELLKPRYKVIADYPGNTWAVGIILPFGGAGIDEKGFNRYPHLFKKLEWYEERKPEEMPEYVKWKHDGMVARVVSYRLDNDCFFSSHDLSDPYSLRQVIPATREEYDAYINSLKK